MSEYNLTTLFNGFNLNSLNNNNTIIKNMLFNHYHPY